MMSEPMPVFLDTDIGPDCDDAAALAILLSLCRAGYARLLGVTHCTGSPYGLAAIDAICRRHGVRVPLGTCADRGFLSQPQYLSYTPGLAAGFAHGYPPDAPQPDALETFVRALQGAPEGGVTLIAIGPLNNVSRFLADPEGGRLMRARVKRLVLMAGCFADPGFTEWNVEMDVPAARAVVQGWPGELDFCPFKALAGVLTGECLAQAPGSPVAAAYRLFLKGETRRPSWDLGTVASAVLGPEPPFAWSEPGTVTMDERGVTSHRPDPKGKHRYLRLQGPAEEGAKWLESLLENAVKMELENEPNGGR